MREILERLEIIRHREVQALHAGLSRRNWHATEKAANELRDRIDEELRLVRAMMREEER